MELKSKKLKGFEIKYVYMARLAIAGSFSVNGVARLHTDILKERELHDFNVLYPNKFNNKTNGITHRRWLAYCNPQLSELINETIGKGWIKTSSIRKFNGTC